MRAYIFPRPEDEVRREMAIHERAQEQNWGSEATKGHHEASQTKEPADSEDDTERTAGEIAVGDEFDPLQHD